MTIEHTQGNAEEQELDWTCGIPCQECGVAKYGEDVRRAVDTLLIYQGDSAVSAAHPILVTRWAEQALRLEGVNKPDMDTIDAVTLASRQNANGTCTND